MYQVYIDHCHYSQRLKNKLKVVGTASKTVTVQGMEWRMGMRKDPSKQMVVAKVHSIPMAPMMDYLMEL